MGKTPNSFSPGFTREDYRNLLSNGIIIEGRRVGPASLFIEIHSGKPGRTSFFVIGTLLLETIRSVAKDHPVYCAPPSWFLLSNPKCYISDIAAFLAREIMSIKQDGPYLLGGYCFNGWIALEIARILRASRKNVDLLFFLDDRAPQRWLRSSLTRIGKRCFPIKRNGSSSLKPPVNETDNNLLEADTPILEGRKAATNFYKNGRPKYAGSVDIVLHRSNRIKNILDKMDWKGLVKGRLLITFIHGSHAWKNHMQIVELKKVLSNCLDKAQKIADRRKNEHSSLS